jgi:hypothetical protein
MIRTFPSVLQLTSYASHCGRKFEYFSEDPATRSHSPVPESRESNLKTYLLASNTTRRTLGDQSSDDWYPRRWADMAPIIGRRARPYSLGAIVLCYRLWLFCRSLSAIIVNPAKHLCLNYHIWVFGTIEFTCFIHESGGKSRVKVQRPYSGLPLKRNSLYDTVGEPTSTSVLSVSYRCRSQTRWTFEWVSYLTLSSIGTH